MHGTKTTQIAMNAIKCLLWIVWGPLAYGYYFQLEECSEIKHIAGHGEDSLQWSYHGLYTHTWCFSTDPDFVLTLNCREVKMTKNTGCCGDKLEVTTTGSATESEVYCDPFQVNGFSIMMKLSSSNGAGNFKCNIKSEPADACYCGYRGENKEEEFKEGCHFNGNPCAIKSEVYVIRSKSTLRIIGGQPAGAHEFTSMAGLVDARTGEIVCGATLINERLALTAAHCVVDNELNVKDAREFALLVGDLDYRRMNDSESSYLYRIRKFVPNEDFRWMLRDDIALIETAIPMWFDKNVGPACLPFKFPSDLFGVDLTIAGWGRTAFGGLSSQILMKGNVAIQYPNSCAGIDAYRGKFTAETMICTESRSVDSCAGDSGGPAYYTDPNTGLLFIFGVIGIGMDCGTIPSINARVSSYIDWIQQTYQHESFCAVH